MYPTALTGDSNLYGRSVEDLPELPGRPEYPMHQLKDQQLHKYIIPLYSRQWRINYTFKKAIVDSRQWYKSATLCRTYEFYSFERMMDFVTEIAKISQKEAVSLITYRSDMPFSQIHSTSLLSHSRKRLCISTLLPLLHSATLCMRPVTPSRGSDQVSPFVMPASQ